MWSDPTGSETDSAPDSPSDPTNERTDELTEKLDTAGYQETAVDASARIKDSMHGIELAARIAALKAQLGHHDKGDAA